MKAYQQLEKDGYIYTLNKKGVFVCGDRSSIIKRNREDAVRMLKVLKEEGFSKEELLGVNRYFNDAGIDF